MLHSSLHAIQNNSVSPKTKQRSEFAAIFILQQFAYQPLTVDNFETTEYLKFPNLN